MTSCMSHLLLLQSKGGFMAHFYLLSETISPTLAWGFLGTNTTLREQCLQFRVREAQEQWTYAVLPLLLLYFLLCCSLFLRLMFWSLCVTSSLWTLCDTPLSTR